MDITDGERKSFLACYSESVDHKAISLYKLLNRICAISEVYMAPLSKYEQTEWNQKEILQLQYIIDI